MSISPRPALTLAAVVALISALVIIMYNVTYVDTSGILTDKQSAAAVAVYGGAAEDYSVVPAEEWQSKLDGFEDIDRIIKVIEKNDGSLAFDIKSKGYKDGFDILVGVQDGKVAGVAVVSVGEETPGLGTKTNDNYVEMTNQFLSYSERKTVYQESERIAPGTTEVEQYGHNGYAVQTYRNVYAGDGTLLRSTKEAYSDYDRADKIILVAPGELPQ